VTPHPRERYQLVGCTAEAALLYDPTSARFQVCGDPCRGVAFGGSQPSGVPVLAGDRVLLIDARDQILGVWRDQGPPIYHALGRPVLGVQLALSDGKVIDVVANTAEGFVIVRIPAR